MLFMYIQLREVTGLSNNLTMHVKIRKNVVVFCKDAFHYEQEGMQVICSKYGELIVHYGCQ